MPIATVLALFAATQLLLSGVECIKLHRRGSPLRPGSLEHFIASPPEAFSGSPRIHDSDPHARISSPTDVHWAQQFTTSSPNGHSDHTSPSGEWDGQLPDELLSYWLDSPTPTARHPQTPATPHIDEDEFVHSLLREPQTPHAHEPYAAPFDHHELHTSAPPSPASSSHTSSTEPPAAGATPPAEASQTAPAAIPDKDLVYHRALFRSQGLRTLIRYRGSEAGKKYPELLEQTIADRAKRDGLPEVPQHEGHLLKMLKTHKVAMRGARIAELSALLAQRPRPRPLLPRPPQPVPGALSAKDRVVLGGANKHAGSSTPNAAPPRPPKRPAATRESGRGAAGQVDMEHAPLTNHSMHRLYALRDQVREPDLLRKIETEMARRSRDAGLLEIPPTVRKWYALTPSTMRKQEVHHSGMWNLFATRNLRIQAGQDTEQVDSEIKAIAEAAGVPVPRTAQAFYNSTHRKRTREDMPLLQAKKIAREEQQ